MNKEIRNQRIMIDLGCGRAKKSPNHIGIDISESSVVDIVQDGLLALKGFNSNSVDEIYSSHFLEHVNNLTEYLGEIQRVLKNNGICKIVVPHFSNPYFYSDPTHKQQYGVYSLNYYITGINLQRKVPVYLDFNELRIVQIKLVFKSIKPRYLRHLFKKIFGLIINLNYPFVEFYEEFLIWMIPAYEIEYTLKKI
jgi:hypothetical protein